MKKALAIILVAFVSCSVLILSGCSSSDVEVKETQKEVASPVGDWGLLVMAPVVSFNDNDTLEFGYIDEPSKMGSGTYSKVDDAYEIEIMGDKHKAILYSDDVMKMGIPDNDPESETVMILARVEKAGEGIVGKWLVVGASPIIFIGDDKNVTLGTYLNNSIMGTGTYEEKAPGELEITLGSDKIAFKVQSDLRAAVTLSQSMDNQNKEKSGLAARLNTDGKLKEAIESHPGIVFSSIDAAAAQQ